MRLKCEAKKCNEDGKYTYLGRVYCIVHYTLVSMIKQAS